MNVASDHTVGDHNGQVQVAGSRLPRSTRRAAALGLHQGLDSEGRMRLVVEEHFLGDAHGTGACGDSMNLHIIWLGTKLVFFFTDFS